MRLFLITGMDVEHWNRDIESLLIVNNLNYKKYENQESSHCYYVVAEEQAIKDFEGKNKQNLNQYENITLLLEESEDIHLVYNVVSPETFSSHSAGTVDESCEEWLKLANDAMNMYFDFMEQTSICLHQPGPDFYSHLCNILKLDNENAKALKFNENENGSESLKIVTRNFSALIELMNKPYVQEAYERIIALSDVSNIQDEDFEVEYRLKIAINNLSDKTSTLELNIEQIKLIEKMLLTEDMPLEEFLLSFQKLRESSEENQQNILLKNNVIDSLQAKLEDLESQRTNLIREVSILKSNTEVLKKRLEVNQQTNNELLESKHKIQQLEAKLELEIDTSSVLENKIKDLHKETSKLSNVQGELEEVKLSIVHLETEKSEHEEHVKLLNIHNTQLREELEKVNAEHEKVQTKYESKLDEVNSLQSVIKDMEKVETEKTTVLTELTEELELCDLQISHLQNELDVLYKDNIENAKFRINEAPENELRWESFTESAKLLQAL